MANRLSIRKLTDKGQRKFYSSQLSGHTLVFIKANLQKSDKIFFILNADWPLLLGVFGTIYQSVLIALHGKKSQWSKIIQDLEEENNNQDSLFSMLLNKAMKQKSW